MSQTNLRSERTSFFGRQRDLDALDAIFDRGERFVTILGTAGIGKTRLAVRYGALCLEREEGAVVFVDLASASGAEDVVALVAGALGVGVAEDDATGRSWGERVGQVLAARGPTLLILDNFEQITPAAEPTVGLWLGLAPLLRVLVTSREALTIAGEVRHELDPLDEADAVYLFAARASAAGPGFLRDDAAALEIVRRLDCLPLAIELAAARAAVLGAAEIRDRLDRRLELLRAQVRGVAARHATLREAIDWSWSLLSAAERAHLAILTVLEGGFTLGAAAGTLGLPEPEAVDALHALRTKSLIRMVNEESETRYSLYQGIREFAAEKLDELGTRAEAEARHAAWFLDTAERWATAARGPEGPQALASLRRELPDLVAACRRMRPRDPASTVRLALAAAEALILSGPHGLLLLLLDEAVAAAGDDPLLAARTHLARGDARIITRRHEAASDLEEAARLARQLGNRALEAAALRHLGTLHRDQGFFDDGRVLLERAAKLFEDLDDRRSLGGVMGNLGTLYRQEGRLDSARSCYERALALHRETGDRTLEGRTLAGLGHMEEASGRPAEAQVRYQAALPVVREVGDRRTEGTLLDRLATVSIELGEPEAALAHTTDAVEHARAVGDLILEALGLAHRAVALSCADRCDEATVAYDEASRIADRVPGSGLAAVLEPLGAVLDVALARRAETGGDPRTATELHARARRTQRRTVSTEEARTAQRLLSVALQGSAPSSSTQAAALTVDQVLEIDALGKWFRPPNGERIDLARKPLLSRLVAALATERDKSPGRPVTHRTLVAAGWPEQALPERTAAGRLYFAVATLRKLGLESAIVTHRDGYLLHPALPVLLRR